MLFSVDVLSIYIYIGFCLGLASVADMRLFCFFDFLGVFYFWIFHLNNGMRCIPKYTYDSF